MTYKSIRECVKRLGKAWTHRQRLKRLKNRWHRIDTKIYLLKQEESEVSSLMNKEMDEVDKLEHDVTTIMASNPALIREVEDAFHEKFPMRNLRLLPRNWSGLSRFRIFDMSDFRDKREYEEIIEKGLKKWNLESLQQLLIKRKFSKPGRRSSSTASHSTSSP